MPRTARMTSMTNIYHVMMRGINRQNIAEDDEDRFHFMNVLGSCKKLSGFRLHAFVLMSNHIHLLIEPVDEPLEVIFKRIGTRYAVWFNRKYQRAGHLFQDRFRSECVDTEQYYKTVLRYILQNPMKAGMEKRPGSYRWSSYLAYVNGRGALTDTEFAIDLFGGKEALTGFLAEDNDDTVMDEEDHDWRLRDEAAKEIIYRLTQCSSVAGFQRLDSSAQKEFAGKFYLEGLSMGQITRLTGMPKTTVFRAVQKLKNDTVREEQMVLNEPEISEYVDYGIVW